MVGSESLCWAGALLGGGAVVTLPVQTIEDNLWGRRAAERIEEGVVKKAQAHPTRMVTKH